ncbi:hypothetical protein ACN27G_27535 [Plantactinospora sp. WMMB334]|uniref:hypothetical protein n=1 Tax=Plantactinospora sp. WMMB334 TaxID=3404119 RepID=UPI003B929944
MSRRRQRALDTRGNIALGAAAALGLFLLATVPSGGWARIHTWLAVALGALGGTALLCFRLARRLAPRMVVEDEPAPAEALSPDEVIPWGESPRVTHPADESPQTALEVRK